ncbi:MAG TPA: response regulator [Reyranella sp.]|nr:response regulator [Reyranella sp.]
MIEDDCDLSNEISAYFSRRQHKVTVCHSLAKARALIGQVTDDRPQAIVCDANLPDGNGVDFFIQMSPTHAGRWILMSGAHDEHRLAALGDVTRRRDVAVVDKPVPLKDLNRILVEASSH